MWFLSREDLESELKDNPDFAVGLLRKLAEEVRGQSKARIAVEVECVSTHARTRPSFTRGPVRQRSLLSTLLSKHEHEEHDFSYQTAVSTRLARFSLQGLNLSLIVVVVYGAVDRVLTTTTVASYAKRLSSFSFQDWCLSRFPRGGGASCEHRLVCLDRLGS